MTGPVRFLQAIFIFLFLAVSSVALRGEADYVAAADGRAAKPSGCHESGRTKVTLGVSQRAVSAGDVLYFRLRNCSTSSVVYSEMYAIDRLDGARWTLVDGGRLDAWRRWLRTVRSGRVGEAQSYAVDSSLEPGRYRIRKEFSTHGNSRATRRVRIAKFQVHDGSLGGGVQVLRWHVGSVWGPSAFTAVGEVGHCAGYPKPRIKRPHVRYRGDKIYIRLLIEKPRYRKGVACAGLAISLRKAITLKRNLSDVTVYDSGRRPPAPQWP